jgi:hypothetical protein
MNSSSSPDAKVLFRVPNEDGSVEVETLWATRLGDNEYRLDNSPFWAYGVSWEDVVFAPFSEEDQLPTFQAVVQKSGNRTVRLMFDPPVQGDGSSNVVLQSLVTMGCSYEGMNKKYVSVNIPADVSLDSVRRYLIESNTTWEHADPTYASLFPNDA